MTCRHDNVDHLVSVRDVEQTLERLVCLDCGASVAFGPSNDEPEAVRIEIRAAGFIACHVADNADCRCYSPARRLPDAQETAARELELIVREIPYEAIA